MSEIPHFSSPETADIAPAQPAPNPGRRQRRAWRWTGLGLGIIATAALLLTFPFPGSEDEPPLILVTGYEPAGLGSSHPALGNVLADWLAFRLGGSGRVQVLDGSTRIHALLGSRNDGNDNPTDRARMLARETGARWLLTGEYFQVGDSFTVVTRVSDAGSEVVVHSFRTAAHASEGPSILVDLVARHALAWVLASTGSGRTPRPSRATQPPDYGAYIRYLTGAQLWVDGKGYLSDPHFRSALAADPSLAGPMAWLIGSLDPARTWLWRDSLAELLTGREAILPPADRALLGWWLARRGEDPAQALEAARAWVSAAPMSADAKWWTAQVAVEMGQAEVAVELLEQLRPGLDKLSGGVYRGAVMESGAWAFHEVGDYPAELAWLDQFRAEPLIWMLGCRRAVSARALMEPDLDFDEAANECASEVPLLNNLLPASLRMAAATELRAHGALEQANQIANEAIVQYQGAIGNQTPPREAAGYWGSVGALRLLTGDWQGSREAFSQAIALGADSPRRWGGLGVAYALSGQVAESERMLDSLRRRGDQPSAYQQARIHASLGHTAEANAIIDGLRPARIPTRTRLRYDVAFDGMRDASGTPRQRD